MSAAAVAADI